MTNHDDLAAQAQHAAAAKDYDHAHDLFDQLISQLRQEGRHIKAMSVLEQKVELYLRILVEYPDPGYYSMDEDNPRMAHSNLYCLLEDISETHGWEIAKPLYERYLTVVEQVSGPTSSQSQDIRRDMEKFQSRRYTYAQRWERIRRAPSDVHAQVLEGIDDIPWADLQHAYGSAADVPQLLRGLLDEAEEVREEVFEALGSNIWHQGTVYEASAYAVPFLLPLLTWKNTPDKHSVLELLACIARGQSYQAVHTRDEQEQRRWDAILAERGTDFATEFAKELRWVEAANSAAAEGLPLYFRMLHDPDRRIRVTTTWMLGAFPQHSDTIVPQLLEALRRAGDAEETLTIIDSLANLLDDSAQSQQIFTDLVSEGGQRGYRAAIILAEKLGPATPDAVVDLIVEQLAVDSNSYKVHRAQYALFKLGDRAYPALLRALTHTPYPETARSLTELLLDMEFYAGQLQSRAQGYHIINGQTVVHYSPAHVNAQPDPPREPASLTASQRQLLIHLLEHDALWEQPHNLLTLYGLPSDREALKEYLR